MVNTNLFVNKTQSNYNNLVGRVVAVRSPEQNKFLPQWYLIIGYTIYPSKDQEDVVLFSALSLDGSVLKCSFQDIYNLDELYLFNDNASDESRNCQFLTKHYSLYFSTIAQDLTVIYQLTKCYDDAIDMFRTKYVQSS